MMKRLCLILLLAGLSGAAWAQGVPEADIKLQLLRRFAAYTTWPELRGNSFNFCVLGNDTFGVSLKLLNNEQLFHKPIQTARLSSLGSIRQCHLLFVTERETPSLPQINRELANLPVLVISEGPVGSEAMIVLQRREQRIAFEIDLARLQRARLDIVAQVLGLAQRVMR